MTYLTILISAARLWVKSSPTQYYTPCYFAQGRGTFYLRSGCTDLDRVKLVFSHFYFRVTCFVSFALSNDEQENFLCEDSFGC